VIKVLWRIKNLAGDLRIQLKQLNPCVSNMSISLGFQTYSFPSAQIASCDANHIREASADNNIAIRLNCYG
jgi:hypothetical protein